MPRQPALGLERRTLRTGAVAARVIPDTGDVAVGARLDMTAQGGGPTLHDSACSSADVGRERMRLLVGGKRALEDGLERHEGHPCRRTQSIEPASGCFVQYHANYPRDKRLVVRLQWRLISMVQVRVGVCHPSVAEGDCVTARWGGKPLEANPRSVG